MKKNVFGLILGFLVLAVSGAGAQTSASAADDATELRLSLQEARLCGCQQPHIA